MSAPGTIVGYPTRADPEKLFRTSRPEVDHEGLITNFLEFEYHRLNMSHVLPLEGSYTARLGLLNWYLSAYAEQRASQIPLSRNQVAFLNAPMPIFGAVFEVSQACYNFVVSKLARDVDWSSESAVRQAFFWWATDCSIAIARGGELITEAQERALTFTSLAHSGSLFPLNEFLLSVMDTNEAYRNLRSNGLADRAVLVFSLLLRSVGERHLLRFIPRQAIRALLGGPEGEQPTVLRSLFGLASSGGAGRRSAGNEDVAVQMEECARLRLVDVPSRLTTHVGQCFLRDPGVTAGLEPGIAVIGPCHATSGLGQATRMSIAALNSANRAPTVLEFGLDNPALTGFASAVIAAELTVPRQINLIHLNAEFVPLAFAYLDKTIYERSYNIGYVFWELDQVPESQRLGLDMLDEVWVASEYGKAIYERNAAIPVRNVGMAVEPLPLPSALSRQDFGISETSFVFLATMDSFSFLDRKNPLGLIASFQTAFPIGTTPDVILLIKTQNRTRVGDPNQIRIWNAIDELASRDYRIRIMDETMPYRDLLGLKRVCDCYVSLHRAEGWGFGLIEAMQLEKPVIATGYSGNMEFCSAQNCFLVDYDLIDVLPREYIFVQRGSRWAEPSIPSCAAHMRRVMDDRPGAAARAKLARSDVISRFSVGATARTYAARLAEIDTIIMNSEIV